MTVSYIKLTAVGITSTFITTVLSEPKYESVVYCFVPEARKTLSFHVKGKSVSQIEVSSTVTVLGIIVREKWMALSQFEALGRINNNEVSLLNDRLLKVYGSKFSTTETVTVLSDAWFRVKFSVTVLSHPAPLVVTKDAMPLPL